jgi:hypothetical protein
MVEEFAAFGSPEYFVLLACVSMSRALDFFSTWVATPNLLLEANPIARKMGWKIGILINVAICVAFALWPLPAIVISTTSILVAARNFQSAWLMRSMGELSYRLWMGERLSEAGRGLFLFCLAAQTVLYAALGGILLFFSDWRLVPFGIGMGIITYAIAVFIYTLLSVWRMARSKV